MPDVDRSGVDERGGEQVDRAQDAGADRLPLDLGDRNEVDGHGDVAEERRVASAGQGPHLDVVTRPGQRLTQRQGVDDAAPRLRRVRREPDAHR